MEGIVDAGGVGGERGDRLGGRNQFSKWRVWRGASHDIYLLKRLVALCTDP